MDGVPRGSPRLAPALLGTAGAVLTVVPLVGILGFAWAMLDASHETNPDAAEAWGYLIGLSECVLAPLSAILGALAGWAAASIRRAQHPGASVGLAAILAGIGVGLLVVALSVAAFARACGWSISCLM